MIYKNYEKCTKLLINTEFHLQKEVVKFLRKQNLLFSLTHTDTMLSNPQLRRESYEMGYTKGMPDLIIYTPNDTYSMLCIELKSPWSNGELSNEQEKVLDRFSDECNALCLVSNDLIEIITIINDYKNNNLKDM
jgi:hypothetical protein